MSESFREITNRISGSTQNARNAHAWVLRIPGTWRPSRAWRRKRSNLQHLVGEYKDHRVTSEDLSHIGIRHIPYQRPRLNRTRPSPLLTIVLVSGTLKNAPYWSLPNQQPR